MRRPSRRSQRLRGIPASGTGCRWRASCGSRVARPGWMFRTFQIPLSWTELIKRTIGQISKDNVLGLAAQLSFYLLLALVPAILFLVALTSFFPGHMVEQLIAQLAGV